MTAGRSDDGPLRPASAGTVRVVAFWRARADAVSRVRHILRELAARTRQEEGCRGFAVLEATDRPGQFVLIEDYAGAQGRARHLATSHFRELVLEQAVGLLACRDVEPYQPLHEEGHRR